MAVLSLGSWAEAQNKVSGKVCASDGTPMAGVTVVIEGMSVGTTTNA